MFRVPLTIYWSSIYLVIFIVFDFNIHHIWQCLLSIAYEYLSQRYTRFLFSLVWWDLPNYWNEYLFPLFIGEIAWQQSFNINEILNLIILLSMSVSAVGLYFSLPADILCEFLIRCWKKHYLYVLKELCCSEFVLHKFAMLWQIY